MLADAVDAYKWKCQMGTLTTLNEDLYVKNLDDAIVTFKVTAIFGQSMTILKLSSLAQTKQTTQQLTPNAKFNQSLFASKLGPRFAHFRMRNV